MKENLYSNGGCLWLYS